MKIMSPKGFTLIEILTVILILSLVLTLVGPMYRGGQKSDLTVLGRKIASDLRYARSVAITSGKSNSIIFDFEKKKYQFSETDELNTIPDGVNVILTLDLADVSQKSGKIHFYPDGSSSGGIIELKGEKKKLKVIISWLHGGVSLKQ